MKRQSLHVKDNAIYDQFTKQQVIWTHGYGAADRYVTRNEWGALLLQWPVPTPPQGRIHRIWSYNALDTALVPQSIDGIVMLSMTSQETVISSQL